MPLEPGKSKEAFGHNIGAELKAGKPRKQAIAIAFSEKRKSDATMMGRPNPEMGHMGISNGESEELRKKQDMRYKPYT